MCSAERWRIVRVCLVVFAAWQPLPQHVQLALCEKGWNNTGGTPPLASLAPQGEATKGSSAISPPREPSFSIAVGIRGKEGRQAVNNSDFAIAQFRFLKRLMMVHGRWNYRRMAKVIVYFFHKNIVITAVIFFFTTNCAYSGQSLFEDYLYAGYNFFLGVPPFCLGFFDKDISEKAAMTYFPCYAVGREKKDLNVRIMSWMMVHALIEGSAIYFLCKAAYMGSESIWQGGTGDTADLQVFGTIVFSVMITAMLCKVVILHYTWNVLCIAGIVFSIWLYFFFLFVYGAWYSMRYVAGTVLELARVYVQGHIDRSRPAAVRFTHLRLHLCINAHSLTFAPTHLLSHKQRSVLLGAIPRGTLCAFLAALLLNGLGDLDGRRHHRDGPVLSVAKVLGRCARGRAQSQIGAAMRRHLRARA